MEVEFYIDPATGIPHIHNHGVFEDEVIDVLEMPGDDRPGRDGARTALGQTAAGRYLCVVYTEDEQRNKFVITAYQLLGQKLAAFRKRQRKRLV